MVFKLYSVDLGIKIGDTNYDFDHCDSVVIEDNEMHHLVRGANAKNKTGLVYTEGVKEPKTMTVTLVGISQAMFNLFVSTFNDKTRCECYCVDRSDGSSRIAKQAIINKQPRQMTVDESPESMNIEVVFETFDLTEEHKS